MSDHSPMRVTPFVLDRTINLPFLFTVALAIVAGIIWAGNVNNRLDKLEERTRGLPDIEVRLARMDERGEGSNATARMVQHGLPSQAEYLAQQAAGRQVYFELVSYGSAPLVGQTRNGYTSLSISGEYPAWQMTDLIYWNAALGKARRMNPCRDRPG